MVVLSAGYSVQPVKSADETGSPTVQADKKAILVVSFGTSYNDARVANIDSVENKIKANFKDYTVRRAFTSDIIIKKLAERDKLFIDTPEQALINLKQEGYTHVLVQPLHIITGAEYDDVVNIVNKYSGSFKQIAVGRSILYSLGGEYTDGREYPNSYVLAVEALKKQLPAMTADSAVVLMGHGTPHPSDASYACFQSVLNDHGLGNVLVGTVEGYPSLDDVKRKLKEKRIKKVTLMPLMLVAGDHANNDMAGDEEDSWKSQLTKEGYVVETYLHGLGENPAFQDMYVNNVRDVLAEMAAHPAP
ncbi:MAG: sirohydrochlorin cobaltochelatase [Firmicutes bacterium]|nr:sirohydrochlorin cobaltochelatase [Bacillota bacterium]